MPRVTGWPCFSCPKRLASSPGLRCEQPVSVMSSPASVVPASLPQSHWRWGHRRVPQLPHAAWAECGRMLTSHRCQSCCSGPELALSQVTQLFQDRGKRQRKWQVHTPELGDSGGVNSLDFCLASLKSLGCFYFRCILSSQWKAVTANVRILHCQR